MRSAHLVVGIVIVGHIVGMLPAVDGHGYMSKPKARNKLANERPEPGPVQYCPHCLNLGGRRTSNLVYPETIDSAKSHGLCGDPAPGSPEACWTGGDCPQQDHMPGGRFYTADGVGGAIQDIYSEGQEIDVEFVITAHHRGFIELRLCDEARVTEACLQKYPPLTRVSVDENDDYLTSAQPINPEYPYMYFLNPVCAYSQDPSVGGYNMKARFKLPDGITCERCVIQMWWITANSCVPPNYRDFDFPARWESCGGDGGDGFYSTGMADCVGTTKSEEFWNCADVSIRASDGTSPSPGPSPSPSPSPGPLPSPNPSPSPSPNPGPSPSPSPNPSPSPSPPPSSGGFYCGWDSCKARGSEWCDVSEDRCVGSCNGEWCPEGDASPAPSPSTSPSPSPSPEPISGDDGCCEKLTLPEYGFAYSSDISVCAAATWNSGENSGMCLTRTNYNTASDTCASLGARLCTVEELKDFEGDGFDCGLDTKKVWTSTACTTKRGKAGFLIAKGINGKGKRCKAQGFNRAGMICCADRCVA